TCIGAPHFSHVSPVSTGLSGLPWASTSLALRHLGKPVQARNGPRGPSRRTIGLPHLSQTCSVRLLARTGLPSASKFIVALQSGEPLPPRHGPRPPIPCTLGLPPARP